MSYDYATQEHRCNGCGKNRSKEIISDAPYTRVARYGQGNVFHHANAGEFCSECCGPLWALLEAFCRDRGGYVAKQQHPLPSPAPGVCPRCHHTGGKHLQSCPDNPAR